MFRFVPTLTMLLAHTFGICAPICFIQCVGPDGHYCIQPMGIECDCCTQHAVADSTSLLHEKEACCDICCSHEDASRDLHPDHDLQSAITVIETDRCGCKHSPLEASPASVTCAASQLLKGAWNSAATDLACQLHVPADLLGSLSTFSGDATPSRRDASASLRALSTTILRC